MARGKGEKASPVHLVNEAVNYASYLYRGIDGGRNEGSGGEKKRSDGGKASTQLATSSLMKAVAAAIQ